MELISPLRARRGELMRERDTVLDTGCQMSAEVRVVARETVREPILR